jgi:hypothetical protein
MATIRPRQARASFEIHDESTETNENGNTVHHDGDDGDDTQEGEDFYDDDSDECEVKIYYFVIYDFVRLLY